MDSADVSAQVIKEMRGARKSLSVSRQTGFKARPRDARLFLQQEEEGGGGGRKGVNKSSLEEDPAAASLKRRVSFLLPQVRQKITVGFSGSDLKKKINK